MPSKRRAPCRRAPLWTLVASLSVGGGHGIGRQMHMDPFRFGAPGRGPLLAAGSVLARNPMLTSVPPKTVVLDDKWTVT